MLKDVDWMKVRDFVMYVFGLVSPDAPADKSPTIGVADEAITNTYLNLSLTMIKLTTDA